MLGQNKRLIRCAGAVVFRGRQVLLVKRGRAPLAGRWSLPGGRIEPGESASAAALREVFEETGIRAEITGPVIHLQLAGEAAVYDISDFPARWVSGEVLAGDDAVDARYVPFGALEGYGLSAEVLSVISQFVQKMIGGGV